MNKRKALDSRTREIDNVTVRLVGADGKIKKLFQENALGFWLLKQLRQWIPAPIKNGVVQPGILNHLSAYGLRIPYLTGVWSSAKSFSNGITDAGRAAISSRINGSGGAAAFTSIGMGTGTTAFNAAQTALITGVAADGTGDSGVHVLPTASVTVSRVTTSVTNDTAQLLGTVSITGTIAVAESGVFNADTNGTMLCRQTFSAINVVSGDSLQFTWKVQNS